jgi:protein-disulfide isomerase
MSSRHHSFMPAGFLLAGIFTALALGACSRPEPSASPAAPPAAAEPSAAQPAASAPPPADAPLTPELAARLVRSHSPVLGPKGAPVTIVEFLDPACEACRAFAPVVKQILFLYPDEVRLVVRYADFHPGSDEAIRLLEAARRQGKFEQILSALFDGQEEWASHHSPDVGKAWTIAGANGLDVAAARKDAASAASTALLQQEREDIVALQVTRTPTFYVNGRLLTDFGPEPLMSLVAAEVKAAK